MIQKDIIQRLIEDIARFLAKVVKLEGEAALEYIAEVYQKELELDPMFLEKLTTDNILQKLTQEKEFTIHQMAFVAEVFAQEGQQLLKTNKHKEGKNKLQKALIIFNFVEQEQQVFSLERQTKIQNIRQLLEHL